MFRPVQFVKYGSEYLFQLGISNTYIAFDSKTETFNKGLFSNNEVYLSDIQLLELYNTYEMEFIREANKGSYINNIIPLNETFWIQTYYAGKKYITKIEKRRKGNLHRIFLRHICFHNHRRRQRKQPTPLFNSGSTFRE